MVSSKQVLRDLRKMEILGIALLCTLIIMVLLVSLNAAYGVVAIETPQQQKTILSIDKMHFDNSDHFLITYSDLSLQFVSSHNNKHNNNNNNNNDTFEEHHKKQQSHNGYSYKDGGPNPIF